jgi:hypothetical protein
VTASSRGWGPGWPDCQTSSLVTLVCGQNNLRLPVRREVAPIFAALVRDLEAARGRPFRPDWSWGFACRPIAGTRTPSNHSWGLAIDLDAPENGFQKGVPGPGKNTMPSSASRIAAEYMMRWGGDYRVSADPMHFEFMGTPKQADALVRALDLREGEQDVEALKVMVRGIQEELNAAGFRDKEGKALTPDGNWGAKTQYAFRNMVRTAHRADAIRTGTVLTRSTGDQRYVQRGTKVEFEL